MAPKTSAVDATASVDDESVISGGGGAGEHLMDRARGFMDRMFESCNDDPRGSVHRAWGVSLIFVLLYFILSIVEMLNIRGQGSMALVIASIMTGICHLVLGVLGTFVLKRFPTSFSVGFLMGILVVLANQNLILFGTFYGYSYGAPSTNHIFGILGFVLFAVLSFVAVLLYHFKHRIVISPIDAKGWGRSNSNNTYEQMST